MDATVDPSLMRGLDTDLTMDTSRGCLALSSSMGLKPLQDEVEGSPDRWPAPRLLHRRWGAGSSDLPCLLPRESVAASVAPGSALLGPGGVGDGPDEAERFARHRAHRHLRPLAARHQPAIAWSSPTELVHRYS